MDGEKLYPDRCSLAAMVLVHEGYKGLDMSHLAPGDLVAVRVVADGRVCVLDFLMDNPETGECLFRCEAMSRESKARILGATAFGTSYKRRFVALGARLDFLIPGLGEVVSGIVTAVSVNGAELLRSKELEEAILRRIGD